MEKIDFVVLWVDSNDPEWIASYNRYRPDKPIQDVSRFRNWNIFRYWFRAVEKYAPWVNKVYLVTNGRFPDWINPNCGKLVLIKHSDYMPNKFLPTFNSRAIELNLGRIDGLSEHFVYFNDDIFINAPVNPEHYFREGLPCDNNAESPYHNPHYSVQDKWGEEIVRYCCVAVINNHFCRKETVRQAWKKWYGPHLWGKPFFRSLLLTGRKKFETFNLFHFEQPMLKSIFKEIWDKEKDLLEQSCGRFRKETDLCQYLIRYWQFASNRFYPVKRKGKDYHHYNKEIVADIIKNLNEEYYPSICINDSPYCCEEDFKFASQQIREALKRKFPNPSEFELSE